jgi:hypothetical protein
LSLCRCRLTAGRRDLYDLLPIRLGSGSISRLKTHRTALEQSGRIVRLYRQNRFEIGPGPCDGVACMPGARAQKQKVDTIGKTVERNRKIIFCTLPVFQLAARDSPVDARLHVTWIEGQSPRKALFRSCCISTEHPGRTGLRRNLATQVRVSDRTILRKSVQQRRTIAVMLQGN